MHEPRAGFPNLTLDPAIRRRLVDRNLGIKIPHDLKALAHLGLIVIELNRIAVQQQVLAVHIRPQNRTGVTSGVTKEEPV